MVLCYAQVKLGRIFSPANRASDMPTTGYNQSSMLFEPPKQLKYMYYRCDTKFHLDTILDMFDDDDNYGLCLISGEDLFIYLATIRGDQVSLKVLDKEKIELQTRTRRGGSSSARYGRVNDKAKNYNKTEFTEMIVESYMMENHTKCKIKKLILAGPTDMKKEISETPLFQQHLQKYLFKIVNTNGIHQTTGYEVMNNVLDEIKYADVRQVDKELEHLIQYNYDTLLIGKNECNEYVQNNNITKLFVVRSLVKGNKDLVDEIDRLKMTIPVILTESEVLKTYGGWIGIKKYQVDDSHTD